MEPNLFERLIPTALLLKDLERRSAVVYAKWRHATTDQEMWSLQGEARALEALKSLPETLNALEEE